jgi:hypothetical protein
MNKCLIIHDRFGNFKKRGWIETPLCGGLLFNSIQSVSNWITSGRGARKRRKLGTCDVQGFGFSERLVEQFNSFQQFLKLFLTENG